MTFLVMLVMLMTYVMYIDSGQYIRQEMTRMGYGDLTAWVDSENGDDFQKLAEQIQALPNVKNVQIQPLIYADYVINGTHSDSEGQLIAYNPQNYAYRFLTYKLNSYRKVDTIKPGEIYISPAMRSSFNIEIGDHISFSLSRESEKAVFTVKGYFEDPFMGSSMIDMKSFLISREDEASIRSQMENISDFSILARTGAMIHVEGDGNISAAKLSSQINEGTELSGSLKFIHTFSAIYSFMMILQNILIGFMGTFAGILLLITLIILGHSISGMILQDKRDLGILRMIGITPGRQRLLQMMQYLTGAGIGMAAAIIAMIPLIRILPFITVTATGLIFPVHVPVLFCAVISILLLLILSCFIWSRTKQISRISPMEAIQSSEGQSGKAIHGRIRRKSLEMDLAVRQIVSGRKRYRGLFLIAILLSVFVAVVGRMNLWLGYNGEGLMNAFSVADHDLGVKPLRAVDMQKIEQLIDSVSPIVSSYEVAMESVVLNGTEYTANALDDPNRFHILQGRTSSGADEIVITQMLAKEQQLKIGDEVTIWKAGKSGEYTITGIYECANQMGANLGMSREGYARIGDVNGYIWCHHYILEDGSSNTQIMKEIQKTFGAGIEVHTNSWSGLDGIVNMLHLMTASMAAVAALFILAVVQMTGRRFIQTEQSDIEICKSIGFTQTRLRAAFTFRFLFVTAAGAVLGTLLSGVFADPVISVFLRSFGIGEFHTSQLGISFVLSIFLIPSVFTLFTWMVTSKQITVKR